MTSKQASQPKRNGRQRWLFRAVAVVFGLSVFVMLEFALAVLDVGGLNEQDDPFVGFDDVRPLFVPNETGVRFEIPRSRLRFFAPESFPAKKQKETFRIFCLGGSTVQGRPYSSDTSFSKWLQLSLETAQPERNWEVINCGGISYASYRLVPILEECTTYEPDLFIVCTGHNEFLEERTYGHIKQTPAALKTTHRFVSQLRTYSLLRTGYQSFTQAESSSTDRPNLPVDADALLNYKNGIEAYHRDPDFRAGVIDHFEHNVRRMIVLSRNANIPLLLVRPPSNLSDCPPFKSQHRDGLSPEELTRWQTLVGQAKEHYRDDLFRSVQLFEQALDVDEEYAATHYELGRCHLLTGDPDRAHESFLRARELDICPLRMIAPLEKALTETAANTGTPLVDAFTLLKTECQHGILSDAILVDHVHPQIRGHQLIANALTGVMIQRNWVTPAAGWKKRRDQVYQQHFNSLESIYFARGLRELKALRAWAAGRADGPEISKKP
ncbi:MAG: SGNH/GDSL hydrolase family protein [Planctomycetaceae bacterium]|nr:SGNH/GDSL hydrolase family protein [Planctomycetaceae bacterium]MBT6487873.1 SGNH/GDSL hydrolase family protein [Planctomycetaceae bacterium]MBT6493950.1 SGNH/GDSL hydrolase family protein [Planctomycetaceae bacterium]